MEVLSRNFSEITHHWNRSPASDHGISAMIALRLNYLIVMYMQKITLHSNGFQPLESYCAQNT